MGGCLMLLPRAGSFLGTNPYSLGLRVGLLDQRMAPGLKFAFVIACQVHDS